MANCKNCGEEIVLHKEKQKALVQGKIVVKSILKVWVHSKTMFRTCASNLTSEDPITKAEPEDEE